MSKTHWKKLTNPYFLGAYALEPGEDKIVTIKEVREESFTGNGGKKEEGIIVRFMESDVKPMICNKTNAKAITKVAGTPYIEDWSGVRIALYIAPVAAFGETTDAVRVRPYPPKEEFFCTKCGSEIRPFNGKSPKYMADYTAKKFGAMLCADCAKEMAEEEKSNDTE